MKKQILLTSAAALALTAGAYVIDWNKIEHWAGEGPNRAALIVQFDEPDATSPGALVWGYRWADGEKPTGETMMREIARASSDMVILIQYTGWMGYTLDGVGYAPDVRTLLSGVSFDLDGAASDSRISFGYFEPNTTMGQTSAPGQEALDLSFDAIAEAGVSHVIKHPLDAATYGYAAYDYDYWRLDKTGFARPDDYRWQAAWYDGYWQYWTGPADTDKLSYSGLGMSSVELEDGMANGWMMVALDGPVGGADATTGASTQWREPNYTHFSSSSAVELPDADDAASPVEIYRLDGTRVGAAGQLAPGLYVVKKGRQTRKIYIR